MGSNEEEDKEPEKEEAVATLEDQATESIFEKPVANQPSPNTRED